MQVFREIQYGMEGHTFHQEILKEEEKTRGWQWADIAAVFYMNF
jgi:hypothetical protein